FRGESVVVVGGGDSGVSEALVLSHHAKQVTLLYREAGPHANAELVEELLLTANIELLANAQVLEILGDAKGVTGLRLRVDRLEREIAAQGVFVYAGLQADSGFLAGLVQRDAEGRIPTD